MHSPSFATLNLGSAFIQETQTLVLTERNATMVNFASVVFTDSSDSSGNTSFFFFKMSTLSLTLSLALSQYQPS